MKDIYFGQLDPSQIGDMLISKVDDYEEEFEEGLHFDRIRKVYRAYYGVERFGYHNNSYVKREGDNGELFRLNVQHLRNILRHIQSLIMAQRPAMECRAVNSDYASQIQAKLGTQILDYYAREKGLENIFKEALETSMVYSEAFVRLEWDANMGEDFAAVDGEVVKKGDVKYSVYTPFECIRDTEAKDNKDCTWWIVKDLENKYDLAAKYPELRDEILSSGNSYHGDFHEIESGQSIQFGRLDRSHSSDLVEVFTFLHSKTPALPEGRQTKFLRSGDVLMDTELPYAESMIFRMSPGDIKETIWGYTPGFDLTALEESYNSMVSTALTNNESFGVQSIRVDNNADIDVSQLADGLRVIETAPSAKIEPLQMTATAPETYTFMDKLRSDMETVSGVNSVMRGQPGPNLRSGNALALLTSQAIQFNSTLQQSFHSLVDDVGRGTILLLKDYAKAPRTVSIVGETNAAYLEEFRGSDLDKINRVVVDSGNFLPKTYAGRVEIADNLLDKQLIKDPQTYFTVLKTGNLDPVTDPVFSQSANIQKENQGLQKGEPQVVIRTDDHQRHIEHHKTILDDPAVRQQPEIVEVVLAHIAEHEQFLQPPAPEGGPEGQPQGGGGSPIPQGGAEGIVPTGPEIQQPNLPSVPDAAGPEAEANFQEFADNTGQDIQGQS